MLRKRNVINIFQILELGVMLNFYAFEKYLPSWHACSFSCITPSVLRLSAPIPSPHNILPKKKTAIVKQTEINNFPIPLIRMTSNKLKPTIP